METADRYVSFVWLTAALFIGYGMGLNHVSVGVVWLSAVGSVVTYVAVRWTVQLWWQWKDQRNR